MKYSFAAAALCLVACGASALDLPSTVATAGDPEIAAALVDVFGRSGVPGGAAAIVRYDEEPTVGSFGVRKIGKAPAFQPDDLVHIGSETKAMNAVLIGRLVDAGVLTFETTIAEALPELKDDVHASYHDVTVLQLLRHTSGAPENAKKWGAFPGKDLRKRRRQLIAAEFATAPAHAPGSAYQYSNFGAMVASAIAEAKADAPWEDLIKTHVFEPLGIESAGYGAPGTKGKIDAPWGHDIRFGKKLVPRQADNNLAFGGAGSVHITLADWGKFVMALSDAELETEDPFLTRATRDQLLEPGKKSYACGWLVYERGWSEGPVLTHVGSNTMWYALAWIAPREGRGFLVGLNSAVGSNRKGVDPMADQMIGRLMDIETKRLKAR